MRLFFIAAFWVGGLMVAGSENDFMPWTNVIGLLMFFISSVMLAKRGYHKYRCRPKYVFKDTKLW